MKSLKRLGLLTVVVAAFMAVIWSPSASAAGFKAEGAYPATLRAENSPLTLTFGATIMSCTLGFVGEAEAPGDLSGAYPEGGVCNWYAGEGTMSMANCYLTIDPGKEAGSPSKYSGTISIGGSGCDGIELDFPSSCDYVFVPQAIKATFTNEGSGSGATVRISELFGFKYTGAGYPCPGGKEGVTGTEATLKTFALDSVGNAIGVHAADLQNGLFMSAKGFDAETFPVSVLTSQSNSQVFTRGTRVITCAGVAYTGVLTAAGSSFTVTPTYQGCTFSAVEGSFVNVELNGCTYVLNSGGSLSVACPKGQSITLKVLKENKGEIWNLCTYNIAAQSGLNEVKYSTVGLGSARVIEVANNLKELVMTKTSGSALVCGSETLNSTTLTGSVTLDNAN